jgi:hypothetical protein
MYKELKCIDSIWIDEIEKESDNFDINNDFNNGVYCGKKELIELLKSKLIDATPILKEVHQIGIGAVDCDIKDGYGTIQYNIDETTLEQFFNTEIK